MQGMPRREADERALELLDAVHIDAGPTRLRQFPHELSGGMLQRVMIAAAIAGDAELLIADEPTTALDVTTQSDVMATLLELRASRGLALLFITHDLELAAQTCDRTAVLYAGRIVEERAVRRPAPSPRHPYTIGLLRARPAIGDRREHVSTSCVDAPPTRRWKSAAPSPRAATSRPTSAATSHRRRRALPDGRAFCHHLDAVAAAGDRTAPAALARAGVGCRGG